MVDVFLMRALLDALPRDARLILVGDADQLPPVGPGDVLRSLVESGAVPCARLHQILRQKDGSSIVFAAHAVLAGEVPEFETRNEEGAFFLQKEDAALAQRAILELVTERLPRRFGLDPRRDVQVLTPMHRGPVGTTELNRRLKQALNPGGGEEIAIGDRVLQTRNDYDHTVFNGEIGRVVFVDPESGEMAVDFEDRTVRLPRKAQGSLQPAYCITVHKSQGGEFPAVVLVLTMAHARMLRRNLLYTALTRAKRVLVVVGSERALFRAVEVGLVEQRRTQLAPRILAAIEGEDDDDVEGSEDAEEASVRGDAEFGDVEEREASKLEDHQSDRPELTTRKLRQSGVDDGDERERSRG